jgi:hypothetical protein
MATLDIGFEWSRAHAYECVPSPNKKGDLLIRQKNKGRDPVRPLELPLDDPLAVIFANLEASGDACVRFAGAFGLLRTPASTGAAEGLSSWQTEIRKMKSLISMTSMVRSANSRNVRMNTASVDVALVSVNEKRIMVLQPRTLLDAMLVQLTQSFASGSDIETCPFCQRWFERGGKARRGDAKFCDERCRNKFYYAEQKRRAGK